MLTDSIPFRNDVHVEIGAGPALRIQDWGECHFTVVLVLLLEYLIFLEAYAVGDGLQVDKMPA